VFLGSKELAPHRRDNDFTVWRLVERHRMDGTRKLRFLTTEREVLWSGTWDEVPADPEQAASLGEGRIAVDPLRLTVALGPDDRDQIDVLIDGEPAGELKSIDIERRAPLIRTLVFETPLAILDGQEHRIEVRWTSDEASHETGLSASFTPSPADWGALLQIRSPVSIVRTLGRSGRAGLVEEVVGLYGDTFSDELLTEILLASIVDAGQGQTPLFVRSAFSVLWLRAAKQPKGVERLVRRILAAVPALAASDEWRVIANQPLKDALADLALYLWQISDQTSDRVAAEVHGILIGLERSALAQQILNGLAQDGERAPAADRMRLRSLRRRGEAEAAAALARDMHGRKDRSGEVRRALVDEFVESGRYLAAASVSTDGQGLSRRLGQTAGDRRIARDVFPLAWVGWAGPAFAGAGGDAEAALVRLATADPAPPPEPVSIFLAQETPVLDLPHRYFTELAPMADLVMLAADQTCGSLPASGAWTVVFYGGEPISSEGLARVLQARGSSGDLLVLYQVEGSETDLKPCGFVVKTPHLQLVSDLLPAAASEVLARNLRHKRILIAGEGRAA
jgi:hypothetical protein